MIRNAYVRRLAPFALLASLAAVAGCGSSPLIGCTGRVLLDGEPVSEATVTFIPKDESRAATGKTDAEGRFRLTTFQPDDGAFPGEHTVTVSAFVPVRRKPKPGTSVDDTLDQVELRWLVPQKYSKRDTSGLAATVSSSRHDFTFKLKKGHN